MVTAVCLTLFLGWASCLTSLNEIHFTRWPRVYQQRCAICQQWQPLVWLSISKVHTMLNCVWYKDHTSMSSFYQRTPTVTRKSSTLIWLIQFILQQQTWFLICPNNVSDLSHNGHFWFDCNISSMTSIMHWFTVVCPIIISLCTAITTRMGNKSLI